AWQAHLLQRLLQDENPFSRKAQAAPLGAMGPALVDQARRDLRGLQALHDLSATDLAAVAARACGEALPFPSWDALRPLGWTEAPPVVRALCASQDWSAHVETLAMHYASSGVGIFS